MDPKKLSGSVLEKLTAALTSSAATESASKMLLSNIVSCTTALFEKADAAKFNAFSESMQQAI